LEKQSEEIGKIMKDALKKENLTVKVEKLKDEKISSMITVSEESRRMQDMMRMYAMNGMDMGFGKEGETLVLNAGHPLVKYVLEHKEGDNVTMICEQLYDLALLQNAPLSPEAMTKFIARSNEIMMTLTK
ncbi:MAG: molecular chaperone HtpG, partial [Kineothrix sp.]|nr:molecular chaperone HtpG [Kineothrix sp.]